MSDHSITLIISSPDRLWANEDGESKLRGKLSPSLKSKKKSVAKVYILWLLPQKVTKCLERVDGRQ